MSRTDMVRCKSLVEATRVLIVEIMNKEAESERENEESGTDADAMSAGGDSNLEIDEDVHDMDVARVYEGTITQLGGQLENKMNYEASSAPV